MKRAQCSLIVLLVARLGLDSGSLQVICSLTATTPSVSRFTNNFVGPLAPAAISNIVLDTSQSQNLLVPANSKKNTYSNLFKKETIDKSTSDNKQKLSLPPSDQLAASVHEGKNAPHNNDNSDEKLEMPKSSKGQTDLTSNYSTNHPKFDKPLDVAEDDSVHRQFDIAIYQDIKRIDNNKNNKSNPLDKESSTKKEEFNIILKKQKLVYINGNEKDIDNSSHIFIKSKGPAYTMTNIGKSFGDLTSESSLSDSPDILSSSTPSPFIESPNEQFISSSPFIATPKPLYDDINELALNVNLSSPEMITSQPMIALESGTPEHDSNCALVLKRTYVIKPEKQRDTDEWGENFVFNDIDGKKK